MNQIYELGPILHAERIAQADAHRVKDEAISARAARPLKARLPPQAGGLTRKKRV
jgi:hypothetical protein